MVVFFVEVQRRQARGDRPVEMDRCAELLVAVGVVEWHVLLLLCGALPRARGEREQAVICGQVHVALFARV